MRRLLSIVAFVVLVVVVSASAQRGGMRASGGGAAARDALPLDTPRADILSAERTAVRALLRRTLSVVAQAIGLAGRAFASGLRNCFGCRRRYGYLVCGGYPYAGYYDPYWWDAGFLLSYDYDEDQARELALADEMNAANLEEQRLREREDRDQDLYARRAQAREERTAAGPATALVFRDQHVEEVRNYAIAGGMLWVLNAQAAKKIPLVQLDLAATVKINDDRGVDFQVPRYEPSLVELALQSRSSPTAKRLITKNCTTFRRCAISSSQ